MLSVVELRGWHRRQSSSTNIWKQASRPLFPYNISIVDTNYNKNTNTIITLCLSVLHVDFVIIMHSAIATVNTAALLLLLL